MIRDGLLVLGRPIKAACVAWFAVAAMAVTTLQPSGAQASGVSGEAYGYYSSVGLFGAAPGAVGPAPRVSLPPEGASDPLTASDADGALAVFGPATVFGGKAPVELGTPPPSGPVTVSTVGKPGPGGSVTSTASITLHPRPVAATCDGQPLDTKNCSSPGGFGPIVPNQGDELHATCTANEQGPTGSTRFVNARVALSTDENGEPTNMEPIPDNPPPNYTREGVITNVGDRWRTVYNEQFIDPDGAITVNALHLYLLGDGAVGDLILGHVRCSMKPVETSPTTALTGQAPPPTQAPSPTGAPPPRPTPKAEGSGSGVLPLALVGGAIVAGLAGTAIWARRRPGPGSAEEPDERPAGEI